MPFGPTFSTCSPTNLRDSKGSWTEKAPIPLSARQEHTTVAVSSTTLAILGGIDESGRNTTDMMQLYDIPSNKWISAAPLPRPLNHVNAAAVDGKIYLLGGLADNGDGAWRAAPECWVYDPKTNSWETLPPMPPGTARGSSAIGVFRNRIWLAGGMTILSLTGTFEQGSVDTVSVFDTISRKWTVLQTGIPAPRDHVGGAVVGSTFYVVGGRDHGQVNVRGTVFSLDLDCPTGPWVTKKGSMPTPRGGLATAAIGSVIYTFGGEGNPVNGSQGVFNETEAYDTVSDRWERLSPMAVPRHGTSAVGVGGRIYIPGGGIKQGAGPVNYFDVFSP